MTLNFARVVKLFSSESTASSVAKQYALMTIDEESNPGSFMFCESNTWQLLSILSNKSNSELNRYAAVRQWVSQVPEDITLLEKIHEKNLMDEELEEELNFIVRKNRILRSPAAAAASDERPSKMRKMNMTDLDDEATCEKKYKALRRGELMEDMDNRPLAYMCNEYVKYNRYALDTESKEGVILKERLTWRDCVKHMAKDGSLGRYQRALYSALAGNAANLYQTECQTWEDVIWAYLNERVENLIDTGSTNQSSAMLDEKTKALALEKDDVMDADDPRILFHRIQSAILSNSTHQLLQRLHDGFVLNKWSSELHIGEPYRAQALRFVSTWILFEREYCGLKDSLMTTALLTAYTELNAQPASFRPVVIASYAAKLAPNDQIHVFSDFLENFDGDRAECIVINKLGKEYNLDMAKILKNTNHNLLTKALQTTKPSLYNNQFLIAPPPPPSRPLAAAASGDCNYDLFFRALHWLLIDDDLALSSIQSANAIIRYFFGYRRIYLVKQLFDMIPPSTYDRLLLEYKKGRAQTKAIDEFDLHRKVMLIFTKYKEWEVLIQSKPVDSGSFDDYRSIIEWRDEAEKQTIAMENNILAVLEGAWLKEEPKNENISTVMYTRQFYIPEILIRYHNLLYLSKDLIEKNKAKCNNLIHYVTVEHRDLFDDITSSNRWEDVVQEFCKSLPQ